MWTLNKGMAARYQQENHVTRYPVILYRSVVAIHVLSNTRQKMKTNIIGITESWANNDITDAELGLEGYVMFRKDRMGRRGGGVLLYIKETIPAYEVQLPEEADCNEAIWCKLVTGHTTVTIGVVYRCPIHNHTEQRKNT